MHDITTDCLLTVVSLHYRFNQAKRAFIVDLLLGRFNSVHIVISKAPRIVVVTLPQSYRPILRVDRHDIFTP